MIDQQVYSRNDIEWLLPHKKSCAFEEDQPIKDRLRPGLMILCTVLVVFMLSVGLFWISAQASFPDGRNQTVKSNNKQKPSTEKVKEQVKESEIAEKPVSDKDCDTSKRFPPEIKQWCAMVTYHAHKHGLPPDLVAALIWQESGGNPLATSRSGAVGLMQIMPRDGLASTFMCVNGPCFANRPTGERLQVPEFNIAYGTRYLASLAARHGNYREALKFYGPMDVGYTYADKVLGLFHAYGKPSG